MFDFEKGNLIPATLIDIIKTIGRGLADAVSGTAKLITRFHQRRSGMKINKISKDELADLIDVNRLKELTESVASVEKYIPVIGKKEEVVVVKKKKSVWKIVVGIIAVAAAIGGIAFLVYKYLNSDYEDEFLDDIDDEFDDDDDDLFEE